jgi:hypothetical protein
MYCISKVYSRERDGCSVAEKPVAESDGKDEGRETHSDLNV